MIRLENRVLLAVPAAVLAFALLATPLLVQPRTAVVQPSYATLPVVDESTVRNLPTYSETLRAAGRHAGVARRNSSTSAEPGPDKPFAAGYPPPGARNVRMLMICRMIAEDSGAGWGLTPLDRTGNDVVEQATEQLWAFWTVNEQ
jgi:hypothetical protein